MVAQAPPPVDRLLDVDGKYRDLAAAYGLRLFAAKVNDPTREAWLPILHVNREERGYTVLSNVALARATRTVAMETRGALERRRVVWGREEGSRAS